MADTRVNLEELSDARLRELLTAYSITQPVIPFTEGQVVLLLKGTGCHASPITLAIHACWYLCVYELHPHTVLHHLPRGGHSSWSCTNNCDLTVKVTVKRSWSNFGCSSQLSRRAGANNIAMSDHPLSSSVIPLIGVCVIVSERPFSTPSCRS